MRNIISALMIVALCATASAQIDPEFKTSTGDALPRFTLQTLDGAEWASSQEAGAKIIIVFDPASAVSRGMLAQFESFVWPGLKDKGVAVIAIARGATPEQARQFAAELKLNVPVTADPQREYAGWFAENGRGVPRIIVADREGNIAYQHAGYKLGREAEFLHVARIVAEGAVMSNPGAGGPSLPGMLDAVDLLGKDAPELHVERWITQDPGDLEGKYVLTEFWATWCGPCLQVMPHLQELSEKHADKLVIRSISDEEPAVVTKFINEMKFTYPIGIDTQRRTADKLRIYSIPHGYITNPEGKVVWQGHPAALVFEEGLLEKILGGE